jgi:hypothetical protein
MSEARITKGRLSDIEDDIDGLIIEQQNNSSNSSSSPSSSSTNTTTVNLVSEIVYDNELLNHPNLLKKSLEQLTFNQILDLSPNLNQDLIAEAIANNDSSIILGGLLSLLGNSSDYL